ncbi:MAG: hypothetical protein AAF716_21895 [Cyanobacteria bacterium P01_D01_bin.1]
MMSSLIGLIGVLVGASLSWLITSRFERRRNAVALYAEFLTSDMEDSRDKALRALKINRQSSTPLSFQEMFEKEADCLLPVSRVVHFWEKTWYLSKSNYIDSKLTKELLCHYFRSHYQKYLIDFAQLSKKRDDSTYQKWVLAVTELADSWKIDHKPRARIT